MLFASPAGYHCFFLRLLRAAKWAERARRARDWVRVARKGERWRGFGWIGWGSFCRAEEIGRVCIGRKDSDKLKGLQCGEEGKEKVVERERKRRSLRSVNIGK